MAGAEAKKTKPETETKPAKTEAAAATPAAAEGAKGGGKKAKTTENGVKERQTFERQRGSQWTLERCRKYARRYKSEAEWVAGSPASYKAATYWNWVDPCCEHMPTNLRLVHSNNTMAHATKKTAQKSDFKVVTGDKAHAAHKANATHTTATTGDAATNVRKLEKKSKTTTKTSGTKKKKAS